jgi:hypothetical protein
MLLRGIMEVSLKGGPANGVTVNVRTLEQSIVLDDNTAYTTEGAIKSPADMLYELSSINGKPVYVFKAFLTPD